MSVHLPPMLDPQRDAWWALLDLHERMPTGWTLVGGQMVHLHCAERGASPTRPTDDADAGIDVRAYPAGLATFTGILQELGFRPDGATWQGHQHRWVKDHVTLDVLIPRGLRPDSRARRTVTGATTLESPGVQEAVDRAEDVAVTVMGREGVVPRPTLLGALVAKAAALEILVDPGYKRHMYDFVTLATLVRPEDKIAVATKADRARIDNMLGRLANDPSWKTIDGAVEGLERLKLALDDEPSAPTVVRREPHWTRGPRSRGGQPGRPTSVSER